MLVRKFICDELYTLLYSNSIFIVNLHPARYVFLPSPLHLLSINNELTHSRPSSKLTLTPHATKYITHLNLSYHTRPDLNVTLLPNATTHHESLVAAITRITALTPNLVYFGLNFWTPTLSAIFPSFTFTPSTTVLTALPTSAAFSAKPSPKSTNKKNKPFPVIQYEASSLKTPVEFDHTFLLPVVGGLIKAGKIKTFALLREGRGRGVLDWDRDKKNVLKGVSRDLRNGLGKVLN
jgi:hypothetical protein